MIIENAFPSSLRGNFLVAMPQLKDPYFTHSVVYLHQYDDKGMTGFIINKPTNMTVADIVERLEIVPKNKTVPLLPALLGGPVSQDQLFLITSGKSSHFSNTITTAVSKKTVQSIVDGQLDQDALFFLGYANWQPGQLEAEIANNDWLVSPYSNEILFKLPYDSRYRAAASAIGVKLDHLSSDVGHA